MPATRRIFISEYLTSGSWPEPEIEGSLAKEGSEMVQGLIADFLKVPECEVVTTWDARLGNFPIRDNHLTVCVVRDRGEFIATRELLLQRATHSLVIAPEFQGILAGEICNRPGIVALNCSREATELCADKLRLAEILLSHGIRTIETAPFEIRQFSEARLKWLPSVIKPRDGAGSQFTYGVGSNFDPAVVSALDDAANSGFEFIQQPYYRGRALSMAATVNPISGAVTALPLAEQLLSDDGRFHYLGSRIGDLRGTAVEQSAERLIRQCCAIIPGLSGYVGFDLIELADNPKELVLVEINPRLTTSYLAYRQLTAASLASVLLSGGDVNFRPGRVEYQVLSKN